MKKILFTLLFIAITIRLPFAATNSDKTSDEDPIKMQTVTKYLIVLGSKKDYYEALKIAKSISKMSGIEYDQQGMVYDKKRGLIVPDNSSDEIYAGHYAWGRFDEKYITIEKSEAYSGLKKGFYIVLGGIQTNIADAEKLVSAYKKYAPDVYIHKTRLYMGCMH